MLNTISEFTPVPKHLSRDDIYEQKEYRKIRNDHTFSYGNNFYLIDPELRYSIVKQKIEIRKPAGSKFTTHFAGLQLAVSEDIKHTKI